MNMRIRLEVKEKGRTRRIASEGPPSRFNAIGRSTAYIRLYSGKIPEDGIRPERRSVQPELLFHTEPGSRKITKTSIAFGGKVYHFDVRTSSPLTGDAYRVLSAIEAMIRGESGPMEELARKWRGETKIELWDTRQQNKLELHIHAADIQDMLERFTRLQLGIERQTTLQEFGIKKGKS